MTTRIEKIIVNKNGSEECFPLAVVLDITNKTITAEELKKEFDVKIKGLGSILDTKEATVIEGQKNKKGKRLTFTAEGLVTENNIDGELKHYVTAAIIRRNTEVIIRENKFNAGEQVVGFRVTRL